MAADDPTAPQPPDAENFHGHDERECGEHRTTGPHRAWCFNCSEWCSLVCPCKGCELPALRAEVDRLTADLARARKDKAAAVAQRDAANYSLTEYLLGAAQPQEGT